MIFPTLVEASIGHLNLNLLAKAWQEEHVLAPEKSPFLEPTFCQKIITTEHFKRGIGYSYGGWLEDRSTLWKGSYLEKESAFIHVGVDLNPPEGTPIASDNEGVVVHIDDDYPEEGGWGPRVLIQLHNHPIVLIYAHLDPAILCKVGDILKPGDVFAKVGPSTHNGGWFPHLHVQSMTPEAYEIFKHDPQSVDGYAKAADIEKVSRLFPDPIKFIKFD